MISKTPKIFLRNDFNLSGLTPYDASKKNITPLSSEETYERIIECFPHLHSKNNKLTIDYYSYDIPYYDVNGNSLTINDEIYSRCKLEKLDPQLVNSKSKKPPKYLQAPDTGTPIYLLPDYDYVTAENNKLDANIIEGEKKTMVAHKLGLSNPIGIPGIWSFGKDEELHPMFDFFDFRGKRVDLWLDSDTHERSDLMRAAQRLAWLLSDLGATTYLRKLQRLKSQNKTGLDDLYKSLLPANKTRVNKKIKETIQATPIIDLSTQIRTSKQLHQSEDQVDKVYIPGLLGEGLTGVNAPPKRGKSSLVHEMMIALSSTKPIGNFKLCNYFEVTCTCRILYCAPEDRWNVLKQRQNAVIKKYSTTRDGKIDKRKESAILNDNLIYNRGLTRRVRESKDPMKALRKNINLHKPDILVIDTLNHIRPDKSSRGQSVYDFEYTWMSDLRVLCESMNISIVVVHHFAKTKYNSPSEQVGGSAGMSGGMENLILINPPKPTDTHDEIIVMARTFNAEDTFVAEYDKQSKLYNILGTTDTYPNNKIELSIVNELTENSVGLTPSQLAEITGILNNTIKVKVRELEHRGLITSDGNGKYFRNDIDLQKHLQKRSKLNGGMNALVKRTN